MMEKARSEVRRRDRAQDDAWIRHFLEQARTGVLATVRDGQPFLNTNLFVYAPEPHAVYVHTARVGLTRDNLDQPAAVCFTAFEMGRLLPADEALEFSTEFAGVTIFGRGRLVPDEVEQRTALQMMLDKYAPHLKPGRDYRGITDAELKRTSVFRIDVEDWSGKLKVEVDDFPGAFYVPPPDAFDRAR